MINDVWNFCKMFMDEFNHKSKLLDYDALKPESIRVTLPNKLTIEFRFKDYDVYQSAVLTVSRTTGNEVRHRSRDVHPSTITTISSIQVLASHLCDSVISDINELLSISNDSCLYVVSADPTVSVDSLSATLNKIAGKHAVCVHERGFLIETTNPKVVRFVLVSKHYDVVTVQKNPQKSRADNER